MVLLDKDGCLLSGGTPSSEWRFHKDIFLARPEFSAIIHTHSMFATTLACLGRHIPAFHYMIAVSGGDGIACAPYALFGSQELSDNIIKVMADRKACLLSNHGMIVAAQDLENAYALAVEVEALCEQYWRILQIEEPKILSKSQMSDVISEFKSYGSWNKNLSKK